jgi:hypothetical protein
MCDERLRGARPGSQGDSSLHMCTDFTPGGDRSGRERKHVVTPTGKWILDADEVRVGQA